jgi:hypothetical protein
MYIMKILFTLLAFYVTFVRSVRRNLSAFFKLCIDFRLHKSAQKETNNATQLLVFRI